MIELKRLKLINWHNFENVTFDCARLTYMIGVNAVGKTTILDAIRYCLTTNRNFNALGNKKSGRTLQGSVPLRHRRPGRVGRPHAGAPPRRPDLVYLRGRLHPRAASLHRPPHRRAQLERELQARCGPPLLHPQPRRSPRPHLPSAGHRPRRKPAGQEVQRSLPDGYQYGRDPQLPGVFISVHPASARA